MADPEYDVSSLEEGIKKAYMNIETFEAAISREQDTIREYREMIRVIEQKRDTPSILKLAVDRENPKNGDQR